MDHVKLGPHAVGFRTYRFDEVYLNVDANLPKPRKREDWQIEPYRTLQAKIEEYQRTQPEIQVTIHFVDHLDA